MCVYVKYFDVRNFFSDGSGGKSINMEGRDKTMVTDF